MHSMFVFATLLVVVVSVSYSDGDPWTNFKITYQRDYSSPSEEVHRQQIFHENLKKIEKHNARYAEGEVSWYMGVNHYADMTPEEFQEYHGKLPGVLTENQSQAEITNLNTKDLGQLPDKMDLRYLFNGSVRQQGKCRSCYAFAVAGAIEAHYYIKYNARATFSPQQIVDCSTAYNNTACDGGWPDKAGQYVVHYGLMWEQDYPYEERTGICRYNPQAHLVRVADFPGVKNNNADLMDTVAYVGPVVVTIDAKEWQFYDGGVFHPTIRYQGTTHVLVLAGYGMTPNTRKNFWLLRNTWGNNWGEDGYIRVDRDLVAPFHIGLGTDDWDTIKPIYPKFA